VAVQTVQRKGQIHNTISVASTENCRGLSSGVEALFVTFNQVVDGSIPSRLTTSCRRFNNIVETKIARSSPDT
jgi:hypothetical protein